MELEEAEETEVEETEETEETEDAAQVQTRRHGVTEVSKKKGWIGAAAMARSADRARSARAGGHETAKASHFHFKCGLPSRSRDPC